MALVLCELGVLCRKDLLCTLGIPWLHIDPVTMKTLATISLVALVWVGTLVEAEDNQPRSRTDQVGHILDFLPTFLEMAGVEHPDFEKQTLPLDGKSLLPVLKGRNREPHSEVYWYWGGNRAVRQGD